MRFALFVMLAAVLLCSGCDDATKVENQGLRKQVGALIAEKAGVDGELTKKQSELLAINERLSDSKARIEELKSEAQELRGANSKLHAQIAEVGERLKAAELSAKEQELRSSRSLIDLESLLSRRTAELETHIGQLQKQQAERKGILSCVVTYYFNANYGYKPDVGAEIFIFPEKAYSNFNFGVFMRYQLARTAIATRKLEGALSRGRPSAGVGQQILEKMGINNEGDWTSLVEQASAMWRTAETGKDTSRGVADGNGVFKRSLAPGKYYIGIRSKHREGSDEVDYRGKLDVKAFEIKGDDEVSIDAKFAVSG